MSGLRPGMSERQLQNAIRDLCRRLGLRVYHTHDSRHSEAGFPDLAIVGRRLLMRELKTDTGRTSKEQVAWLLALESAGVDAKTWRASRPPQRSDRRRVAVDPDRIEQAVNPQPDIRPKGSPMPMTTSPSDPHERTMRVLNILAKWRVLFTGWQLGTRPKCDPEGDAVRDHREATILLRAEMNALVAVLRAKGVFTDEEWLAALELEAQLLAKEYELRFPGVTAHEDGLTIDNRAQAWMKGWKP